MKLDDSFKIAIGLHTKGKIVEAKKIYEDILKIKPDHFLVLSNLGIVFSQLKESNKAVELFHKAIEINPQHAEAHYNLGNIYRELGDYIKSIKFYKNAITINPNLVSAFINLSISLNKNGNLKEAISYCEEALKKDPNNVKALNNLGEYNHEIGNEDLSITYYKKALEKEPENLRSKWLMMNTFPIIYKNFEQIESFKKHFEKKLKSLEDFVFKNKTFNNKQILNALLSSTNFYLHYQGDDITDLQKRYGSVLQKLTSHVYPEFQKKILLKNNYKFKKIGFISSFFCDHVISKLFKNWIIKLNKDKFKTFVYHTGMTNDFVTKTIKENSYSFFHKTNIDEIINKINSDQLDILIFLDIGMDPKIQILGSLKLAPIQCCAYGVPVTTGMKSIDYFFSADSMENNDSQKYYSEKLIKLPDLGVDYDYPKTNQVDLLVKKKRDDKTIFLNLQSNFKLLPQHDHIYFEIIKKIPKCKFWFIGTKNEFIAGKFKKRISLACKQNGLSLDDFFVFYPQSSYQNYLNLINESDIILDSLDWSGLNTSLEAISLNKPIITLPSNFMRGRHTYAILKILKLDELICNSKKNYINLAAKLSENSDFRVNIVKKIKENKKLIFGNNKTIKFLEDFFDSLIK